MVINELFVGQFAETTQKITRVDVARFATATGDINPVHLSEGYAATTRFKECIAHGALLGAYISALIGMKLPGNGSVVTSLNLKFRDAVKLGSEVTTRVEVKKINVARRFVTLICLCLVAGKPVVKGQALVMLLAHE